MIRFKNFLVTLLVDSLAFTIGLIVLSVLFAKDNSEEKMMAIITLSVCLFCFLLALGYIYLHRITFTKSRINLVFGNKTTSEFEWDEVKLSVTCAKGVKLLYIEEGRNSYLVYLSKEVKNAITAFAPKDVLKELNLE